MQTGVNAWLVGSLLWMAACADAHKAETAIKPNHDAPNARPASAKNAETPRK